MRKLRLNRFQEQVEEGNLATGQPVESHRSSRRARTYTKSVTKSKPAFALPKTLVNLPYN
jgi:hypothetical protein